MNSEKPDSRPGCFLYCEHCRKKMVRRMPNGILHFLYGKKFNGEEVYAPVEIYIHGSIQMRCIDKGCREWNTFTLLPNEKMQITSPVEQPEGETPTPRLTQKTLKGE